MIQSMSADGRRTGRSLAIIAMIALRTAGGSGQAVAACAGLGNQTSTTSYNASANWMDRANAVAIDGSGNVVVAGYESDGGGGTNWRIRRYSPDLATLLSNTIYTGAGTAPEVAHGIAIDGSGNVVVVGVEAGTSFNWRIRKYDATLSTLLGTTDYNGPYADDFARAVAIDGSGNVVVVGSEQGPLGDYNWRIRRYDPTLTTLLATTSYDGPTAGTDYAIAVAIDVSGDVIVGGEEDNPFPNWRLRRYDQTLTTLVGTTAFNGSGNGADTLNGLALDGSGNVVAAGFEQGFLGGPNWMVRKYNPTLTALLGSTDYVSPGNASEYAYAVTLNASGNVVVAGYEYGTVGADNWLVRVYDPALTTLVSSTDYDVAGGSEAAYAVVADPEGHVVVAGYDQNGVNENWRVIRYICPATADGPSAPTGPRAEQGGVLVYPNPVTGDRVTMALDLQSDATQVEVAVFNTAMQRVRHETFADVGAGSPRVTLDGLSRLAPGVYLLRLTATVADGTTRTFPTRKLVVKR